MSSLSLVAAAASSWAGASSFMADISSRNASLSCSCIFSNISSAANIASACFRWVESSFATLPTSMAARMAVQSREFMACSKARETSAARSNCASYVLSKPASTPDPRASSTAALNSSTSRACSSFACTFSRLACRNVGEVQDGTWPAMAAPLSRLLSMVTSCLWAAAMCSPAPPCSAAASALRSRTGSSASAAISTSSMSRSLALARARSSLLQRADVASQIAVRNTDAQPPSSSASSKCRVTRSRPTIRERCGVST
mmetsp:Transcript_48711/g.150437  ORF Transcript_48711/g.150437 Transcript_48711/m.150437 type:complete len:258 (+) Transcript_48711:1787-2560(+)